MIVVRNTGGLQYVSSDKVCATTDNREADKCLGLRSSSEQHPNSMENFQADVLAKQKGRILSTWPATTPQARQIYPEFCALYECIREYGLPNFLGARIPIRSALVIENWEKKLKFYHDKDLVPFLKYGWPVGYHADNPPPPPRISRR